MTSHQKVRMKPMCRKLATKQTMLNIFLFKTFVLLLVCEHNLVHKSRVAKVTTHLGGSQFDIGWRVFSLVHLKFKEENRQTELNAKNCTEQNKGLFVFDSQTAGFVRGIQSYEIGPVYREYVVLC